MNTQVLRKRNHEDKKHISLELKGFLHDSLFSMSSLIDTDTIFKSITYIKVLFDKEKYIVAYIDFVKVRRTAC